MANNLNIAGHQRRNYGKPVQKANNFKGTLLRLLSYLKEQKLILVIVYLFVIISTIAGVFATRFIGYSIDSLVKENPLFSLKQSLFMLTFLYVLNIGATWFQSYYCIIISEGVVFEIRKQVFSKLQRLPLKFFDTNSNGDVMSRITNDIDNISNTLNTTLAKILSTLLTVISIFIFMLTISPILTFIAVLVIPALALITKFVTKHSSVYFNLQQAALGNLNGKIEEAVSGQRVIKVFVKEESEIAEFKKLNDELCRAGFWAQLFSGVVGPLSTLLNNLSYGLVAAVGGILILKGNLDFGAVASFLIFSKQFGRPFNEMLNQYNLFLSAIAGAERVFEILDEKEEPKDIDNAVELVNAKGNVVFNNVNFSYNKGTPILKNINLDVKSGETIALVGPTGAGKTTIINMLTRFYDIESGTITIDGNEIRNINKKSLRLNLGIVLQDTYLFSGTIMENIRYGKLTATDEEVYNAAIYAKAHEFIKRLPNGYNTILSEDDDSISHGQKQMLAIARAILANPSILILDEATSSIDTRTEIKIQEAMLNLMKGRTSFVIAHRLSTIQNADLIVVINDGRIIEKGSHKELLSAKGFYSDLYENQFKGGI